VSSRESNYPARSENTRRKNPGHGEAKSKLGGTIPEGGTTTTGGREKRSGEKERHICHQTRQASGEGRGKGSLRGLTSTGLAFSQKSPDQEGEKKEPFSDVQW